VKRLFVATLLLAAAGCATRAPAPVVERQAPPVVATPAPPPVVQPPPVEKPPEKPVPTHTVKRGETLVSIALQYGLDYRELAAWNNIANFNVLGVGQVLVLAAPAGSAPLAAPVTTPLVAAGPPIEARPLANTPSAKVEPRGQKVPFSERALSQLGAPDAGGPAVAIAPPVAPPPITAAPPATTPPPVAPRPESEKASPGTDTEDVDWMWPVKGKVLAPFSETAKGMDIGGRKGAPVLAAASGRVVYAGAGLRGYGKLVIIKHNNKWLSAYAHNDNLLVAEQQEVRKGQKIAEMGSSDADQVKLHFEVRREGKPVDPAKVLPPL
jgi:lipoprotein NlpD